MTSSKRRLGRSPARRSDAMQLSVLQEEYLLHHGALGHSEKTKNHYKDSFRLFGLFLEAKGYPMATTSFTTARMNEFALYLRETPTRGWRGQNTRTEAGIHGIMVDMRAFVRWLYENDKLDSLPKVPVNKLPQVFYPVLNDDEIDRVFATKQLSLATEIGQRNRALIAFMLDTGVRRSELANLQMDQLDIREGQARIIGKGRKERFVFFAPATAELLKRWIAIRGDAPGEVFWLSFEGVKTLFNRIKREAGLEQFFPHMLRHTTATNLLAGGADTHSVRRMLGHASVLTTEKYLSMAPEQLKAKHSSASPYERVSARNEPIPIQGRRRLKSAQDNAPALHRGIIISTSRRWSYSVLPRNRGLVTPHHSEWCIAHGLSDQEFREAMLECWIVIDRFGINRQTHPNPKQRLDGGVGL